MHCSSDAAFLCDVKVHDANSLASRHRHSGRTRLLLAVAGSPAPDEDGYESVATSCVPTTDSAASEAMLEGWAKRTGLASGSEAHQRAVRVLLACTHDLTSTRVPMAAVL